MKKEHILTFLKVAAYIAMIGYFIEAGSVVFSFCLNWYHSNAEGEFMYHLNLGEIYAYNKKMYYSAVSLLVALPVAQALLWWSVIELFPQINLEKPFDEGLIAAMNKMIQPLIGYGIIGFISRHYFEFVEKRTGQLIDPDFDLGLYLFILGVIVIVTEILKKGLELKNENELTI
ncbi:MAG: DUF2975 domain-containing protein [Saprospiraceae bacterium]|nr:DUF2975 domain-containing protein [Saprospiraceae bacterium]